MGWTLEYEMFFYVVFALTLFIKTKDIYRLILLSSLIITFVLLGWYGSRAIEFLYGGIIFIIFKHYQFFNHYQNNKFWLLTVVTLLGVILMPATSEDSKFIVFGIPASLIFISMLLTKDIQNKLFNKLGDASYSIYLIQVFSLPVIAEVLTRIAPNISGFFVLILMVLFSIALGYLLYILVESKIVTLSKKRFTITTIQ